MTNTTDSQPHDSKQLTVSAEDRFDVSADYRPSAENYPESVQNALHRADTVAKQAATHHDLDHVFAAVSGGHDSQTALHVAHTSAHLDLDGVVYIDTSIGIPDSKKFARKLAAEHGLDFYVVDDEYRKPQETFENLVKVYGFPGPGVHERYVFHNLKGKPLGRWTDEFDGDVGLVSGVMKAESNKRSKNIGQEPIQEKDEGTWISVLYDWVPETVAKYRQAADLEDSPTKTLMGLSGDCLCGCFGLRDELRDLKTFYPNVYKEITRLERIVVRRVQSGLIPEEFALWGHGNITDKEWAATEPAQSAFNLCSQCDNECYSRDHDLEPITTAEQHHRADVNHLGGHYCFYCVNCDAVVTDPAAHRKEVHPDAGASPSDLDMRRICPDGAEKWTSGRITTKNPDGDVCDHHQHTFEEVDTPNGLAKFHCPDCGAYYLDYFDDVDIFQDGDGNFDPYRSAPLTPDVPFEPQRYSNPDDEAQAQLSSYSTL